MICPSAVCSVQPAAAADRQVLDGAFQPARPAHAQRRLQALVVGVRAGEVAVVRVPVVLRVGERAGERAADLRDFQILRRQRRLAVRPQHVEVAVLARHIDAAVGDRDRRGDRRAERRRERPRLAAGQRHDVQLAVQAAVDGVVARQHRRADGGRRAEHLRLLLAGAVPAQPQPVLGPHPVDVVAADAHRREAQQAGQVDRRLGALDEIGLHLAVGQAAGFRPGPRCRGGATARRRCPASSALWPNVAGNSLPS